MMVPVRTLSFAVSGRNVSIAKFLINLGSIFSLLLFTSVSLAQTLTYEGTLYDSAGAAIAESGVKLKAEIFDNALTCVLYEREYILDLSSSAGHFDLDLSTGTAPSAQPHTANTLTQVLSNAAGNNVTCANSAVRSFSGVFVKRQIRISVLEVNAVDISDIQLPAQDLEMVAFAGEAETSKKFTGAIAGDVTGTSSTTKVTKIQGVDVDATVPTDGQILKYDNGSGKYVPTAIDSSIITDNSVTVDDLDFASSNGIDVPVLTASPGGPSAGQIYYNSVDNKVYFYNGSGWIDTGAGGGDFNSDGSVALTGNLKLAGNYLSGDGGSEGVFVDATGNVGIGMASPNAKLTIEGVVTLDQQTGDPAGTAGYGSVYAKNDGKLYYRDGVGAVSDLTAIGGSGTVTQVDAGTGLAGGSITATGTIALANTAVSAGTYGSATQAPSFTVDAQGRLTAAANVTITDNDTTYSQVTGAVDGLMITTDKTKLDGIESNATADQTAAEMLTAVKTVDGAASGLDADLLDAQSGTYYLAWGNLTGVPADIADGDANTQLSETIVDGYANNNGYLTSESQSLDGVYNNGSSVTVDSTDVVYNLSSTQDFHIQDAGGVAFTVTDSGNVGIGTTNPQSTLEVDGYIQIDVNSSPPPASDCNALAEYGRMRVDPDSGDNILYICTAGGWQSYSPSTGGGAGCSGGKSHGEVWYEAGSSGPCAFGSTTDQKQCMNGTINTLLNDTRAINLFGCTDS